MRLTRGEKQFLFVACALASLAGAFAGYVAYTIEEEHQFHGGVLEEDAAAAMWHLRWSAVAAFTQIGLLSVLLVGVVPLVLRRVLFPAEW